MKYEMHDPTWTGTAYVEDDRNRPADHGVDDFSSVADHYLLSASGFPPADTADLELRVVDVDMNLNRELLRLAKDRVEVLDGLDPETRRAVVAKLDHLLDEHFPSDGYE